MCVSLLASIVKATRIVAGPVYTAVWLLSHQIDQCEIENDCLCVCVYAGVAMAEVLQTLNKEYKSTFFMSYFVRSSYSVLYVGWALWRYVYTV